MSRLRRPHMNVLLKTPINPKIGDTLYHDPRRFGPGFDPSRHPDVFADEEIRQELKRRGILDIGAYLDLLAANNMPPQLVQVSFPKQITAANTPVKLIPKNTRRQSWRVSNYTNAGVILYSFDAPMQLGGTGTLAGIPIGALSADQELNGSVSINDIWVFTNDPTNALTYPIPVIGYEGGLSLVGNASG